MGLPEKPKKPKSSFMLYLLSVRRQLATQNPGLGPQEIVKLASEQWLKVPEHEKKKYLEDYESKNEVYKAEMEKFNKLMTTDVKKQIKELEAEEKMKKAKRDFERKLRAQEKELKKPQHPGSVVSWFCKSHGSKTTIPVAAKMWRELPESKKEAYKAEYSEALKTYEGNLLKWEEEMLRKGNIDLVRLKSIRQKFCSVV